MRWGYALDSVAFHRVEGRRSCDTFCHFLTGTCLSQTLIIFVGIALFASIAVLQTTVYLVLEGINTRSFRCCSKVLNLYIVCAKVRTSGILLSYGTYAFSLFNKRPNGFYFLLLLSCLRGNIRRSSSLDNVIKVMSSNVTRVFCHTIK